MADTFGAISIPVAVPAAGFPVTDPALKYIADFLKACLVAKCGTAWAAVATTNEPIVREVFYHDPAKAVCGDNDLPALYVWRERVGTERVADDWTTEESIIRVLWLLHPANEDDRITHTPAINGIAKVMRICLFRGRDPSWVVSGDTDTRAATRGSLLTRWCGFDKINVGVMQPAEIVGDGEGGAFTFDGLICELTVTETMSRDQSVWGETPYRIEGTVGIAEDGVLPGDGFETVYAAGCHPAELYGATEAIEADSPDLTIEPDALVASAPGRILPATYTATSAGAQRPTAEPLGWNGAYRSMQFEAGDLLSLAALTPLVAGDDQAFSIVLSFQFVAHALGSKLWSFFDAGTSYMQAYSVGAAGTIMTARCDAAGTVKSAAGTTVVGTDRAIGVWSFTGKLLTTHINGVRELNAADLDVGSLTLTFATIGGGGASAKRLGALWFIPSALSDADAVLATARMAERWPYA